MSILKIIFLSVLFFSFADAKIKTSKSPRRPTSLEVTKIKVQLRMREARSLFEISLETSNMLVQFVDQKGRRHKVVMQRTDFSAIVNSLSEPAPLNPGQCREGRMTIDMFGADKKNIYSVVECYSSSTDSWRIKTDLLRTLAVLAAK